ncbi:hypothetical protein NMY22_g12214 [Coprinellus aureogranulatus]|nr:hypothetical protein NMY22_g12214 [Coprinellus aureogranulatus]
MEGLFRNNLSCPARCRDSAVVRRRDVRTLAVSVVPTTVDDDELAVLRVLDARLRERKELISLTSTNARLLEEVAQRVSVQLSSLSRLSASFCRARQEYDQTVKTLQETELRLKDAIAKNSALIEELLMAQKKLREVSTRPIPTMGFQLRRTTMYLDARSPVFLHALVLFATGPLIMLSYPFTCISSLPFASVSSLSLSVLSTIRTPFPGLHRVFLSGRLTVNFDREHLSFVSLQLPTPIGFDRTPSPSSFASRKAPTGKADTWGSHEASTALSLSSVLSLHRHLVATIQMYSRVREILAHDHSVTCLAFSPDGTCLASGDDGGLVLLSTVPDGEECARYHFEDSVTAMTWAEDGKNLFVGLANCRLHFLFIDEEKTYSVNFAPGGYEDLPKRWRDKFQINCLTFANGLLAIGVGVAIHIVSSPTPTAYAEECTIAPFDTEVPSLQAALSSVPPTGLAAEVRSIHFIDEGRAVIVSFLEEGIRCYDIDTQTQRWILKPKRLRIGKSAVDRQGKLLACSNLYDGFDLYDISSRKARRWLRTIHQEAAVNENVILPVEFVHEDSSLLLGSSCGTVVLCSVGIPPRITELDHGADMIIALAAFMLPGKRSYIATACGEEGPNTYVRLWVKKVRSEGPSGQSKRALAPQTVRTENEERPTPPTPIEQPNGDHEGERVKRPGRSPRQGTTEERGSRLGSYAIGVILGVLIAIISTHLLGMYKAQLSPASKPETREGFHRLPPTLSYAYEHRARDVTIKNKHQPHRHSTRPKEPEQEASFESNTERIFVEVGSSRTPYREDSVATAIMAEDVELLDLSGPGESICVESGISVSQGLDYQGTL